jgi:hypothetical protein
MLEYHECLICSLVYPGCIQTPSGGPWCTMRRRVSGCQASTHRWNTTGRTARGWKENARHVSTVGVLGSKPNSLRPHSLW